MSFLYFFPGRETALSRNQFNDREKECGVADVLRDASIASANTFRGPDGGQGLLAMIDRAEFGATNLAYDPDKQHWTKASPHHWVGYWKESPPTPELLQRPDAVGGEAVEIDGRKWVIPVCGPAFRSLPTVWRRNGKGWVPEVVERYRWLMEESEKINEDIKNLRTPDFDFDAAKQRHLDFCARLLSVNHHVGDCEISVLGVMTEAAFVLILRASMGQLTYEREMEREKREAVTVQAG